MSAASAYSSLDFRSDLGILFFRWLQPVNTQQVIDGYSSVLQAHEPEKIHCWLFDTRRRGPASPEGEKWYFEIFLPDFLQQLSKPHFIAVLLTPAHFQHVNTQIGMQKFEDISRSSLLTMQFFDSEHNAVSWLQESVLQKSH